MMALPVLLQVFLQLLALLLYSFNNDIYIEHLVEHYDRADELFHQDIILEQRFGDQHGRGDHSIESSEDILVHFVLWLLLGQEYLRLSKVMVTLNKTSKVCFLAKKLSIC